MPCWYYDKKELRNTPSAQDGIDFETESRYRKEGARFIIDTGSKMDLGYNTTATGVVYFHRFYMFHSFCQFPRYVTACCCLFLAGKVEETPKKCNDIIRTARSLLSPQKFATFGDDPKEEVMTLERILLQTIKFDLQVEHPYSYLLRYAKCLKGDKAKLQKMVQMAWTFVNDSLCTTLALQWEPEIIAVALMYLAGKLSQFEVIDWVGRTTKHLRWWDMFVEDVTMDLLEDICHQVLDLYSQPAQNPAPDSPPLQPRSTQAIPAAIPKSSNGHDKSETSSGSEPVTPSSKPSLPPDVPPFPYQTFTGAPPHIPSFPTAYTTSLPAPPGPHIPAPPPGAAHMAAPPPGIFQSYVAPPPHFATAVPTASAYYGAAAPTQPHRPYYPPP